MYIATISSATSIVCTGGVLLQFAVYLKTIRVKYEQLGYFIDTMDGDSNTALLPPAAPTTRRVTPPSNDDEEDFSPSAADRVFDWAVYYLLEPLFFLFVRRQPAASIIVPRCDEKCEKT